MKEATLFVDLEAIKYNYRHLKCYYKKNVIAVLKDNAYGVGLVEVMNALKYEEGLIIAINNLNEAKLLRENDFNNDILYLNIFDKQDLETIKKYDVSVVVESLEQLDIIANTKVKFHLKFNTGMNRLGLNQKDSNIAIDKINKNIRKYNLVGLMTHFANSDSNHESYYIFEKYVKQIKKENLIIHCFASASLNETFDDITNYIRVGIKLYGIGERNSFLHNALTLKSPVISIKKINKGDKVGYDYSFVAPYDGYVYLLPIGYGQGYGRFNNTTAFYDYNYLKQAGKISMDYSAFFLKDKLKITDLIELFGKNVPLESVCHANNIDPHEILVRLKVKKQYLQISL